MTGPTKPVQIINTGTAFVGVKYPYRETLDLYVVLKDKPIFCAQCEAEFPVTEFRAHIESHDRRRKKKP